MNKLKKKYIYKNLKYIENIKIIKNKKVFNSLIFNSLKIYKILNFNILEINNIKNIYIPNKIKINSFFTIKKEFQNILLFNYKLNFNILYIFNKNMFIYNKNKIKGRIFLIKFYKNKIFIIFFLGIIFYIKKYNLFNYYLIINKKKNIYFKIKKRYNYNFYLMKKKIEQLIINKITLKYLNFNIIFKKKFILTRISYINFIKKKYI